MVLLKDASRDRNNNLNILRFSAAIMVVFSHAYPLGSGDRDPLLMLTNGKLVLAVWQSVYFSFLVGSGG